MKQTAIYIYTFLFAALVFYGGAGVNIVSYCCDDCRAGGVEVVLDDKCCEVHGHSHQDEYVVETSGVSCHTDERCCDLTRVDFDWNNVHSFIANLQPVQFDLFFQAMPDLSMSYLPIVKEISSVMPTGPPLCPRSYLSLLTTLLI